jgi:hypothetical protein
MAVAPLNSQRYEMILDVNGSKNLMQGWKMGTIFGWIERARQFAWMTTCISALIKLGKVG